MVLKDYVNTRPKEVSLISLNDPNSFRLQLMQLLISGLEKKKKRMTNCKMLAYNDKNIRIRLLFSQVIMFINRSFFQFLCTPLPSSQTLALLALLYQTWMQLVKQAGSFLC